MKWNILVGSLVLGASLCTPSFAGGLLDRMLGLKGSGCDSTCCDTGKAAGPSCGVENACGPACGNGCGAGPTCGVENACGAGPSCGIENACGAGPSCGIENACGAGPSCGVENACCKPRRKPLLELLCAAKNKKDCLLANLKSRKASCDSCAPACEPACGVEPSCGCEANKGCAAAAPSCGCETVASCDSGCGRGHKLGLLSRIFKHKGKNGCDTACDACCETAGCTSCGTAAPAASASAAPMPPAPVVDPSAYLQSNRRVIQPTSYVR